MKVLDMVGYHRKDMGGSASKRLRAKGLAPCVLYGGGQENVHFSVPMILFRDLVYTPEVAFVNMDIEGTEYRCILQDIQFHPVSEMILHADFLLLQDDKPVRMNIPVRFVGSSPGLLKGGKLVAKKRKLKVEALPGNMPSDIEVSVEGIELGESVKVRSINQSGFTILDNDSVPVVSVMVPRALRSAQSKGEGEASIAE